MDILELGQKLPASANEFRLLYRQTLDRREAFWAGQAGRLDWQEDFSFVVRENFSEAEVSWFGDGRLNAAQNALDRVIGRGMGDRTALTVYHKNKVARAYTFHELRDAALTLAAAFSRSGLVQGDCIALNLPSSPEFIISALAAAYLGITYLPVGCHLPAVLVAEDVKESRSKLLIISHCAACDDDRAKAQDVQAQIGSTGLITVGDKLDTFPTLAEYMDNADPKEAEPAYPLADFPLFATYENRVAGKPMGTVFGTGGFLVQAHASFDAVFNQTLDRDEPVQVFTTLEPAKSAAQAYGIWGPLISGAGIIIADQDVTAADITTVLAEQPACALLCQPSLISDLKEQLGKKALDTDRRFVLAACCGDALPPRLVSFAAGRLVEKPEQVVNMWVQNKCGAALINGYPARELNRPGVLGFGALGVEPLILNDFGKPCKTNVSGNLVFKHSWPAMGRPTFGAERHFIKTCLSKFPGYFHTFDGVRSDKDGFYWFMGRLDDVVKIKGQSLGTGLIESILMSHPMVDEAAVIGTPGGSGQELVVFLVTAVPHEAESEEQTFVREINAYIAEKIGPFAVPEKIILARQLPRTGTGKLVRGMLRRIATGDGETIEDTSHLANAESIDDLIHRH